MKGMMGKLERYMDGKGLQLKVRKSKMMRCRKGVREMEEGGVDVEGKGGGGSEDV